MMRRLFKIIETIEKLLFGPSAEEIEAIDAKYTIQSFGDKYHIKTRSPGSEFHVDAQGFHDVLGITPEEYYDAKK